MAGKTNSTGKKSGGAPKGGQARHPDGSPRLPGFFDDYGGSGVRLIDNGAQKKPAAKKPGKKK